MSKDSPMDREFQRISEEILNGNPSFGSGDAFNDIALPTGDFLHDHDHDDDEEIEVELADLPIRDGLLDDGALSYEVTCYWPGPGEEDEVSITHGDSTHALVEFKGDGQWEFTSSNLTPIELVALLKHLAATVEENLEHLDEQWEARLEELGEVPPPVASEH